MTSKVVRHYDEADDERQRHINSVCTFIEAVKKAVELAYGEDMMREVHKAITENAPTIEDKYEKATLVCEEANLQAFIKPSDNEVTIVLPDFNQPDLEDNEDANRYIT